MAAADRYIEERETMRLKLPSLPKHRRYDPAAGGSTSFAGVRRVEGQLLALLKRDDEIMVLPVDAGTARRLKRVAVGEPVRVTDQGSVAKAKGRKL